MDAARRADTLTAARQLLAACRTATLATVASDGAPGAANVQFAADEKLTLYFISSPTAAHSRNLARDRRAAVTVYDHADGEPQLLRGVQMRGDVERVPHEQSRQGLAVFLARFPLVTRDPDLLRLAQEQALYRFQWSWMRYIDNRRGFGFSSEISGD